MKNYGFIFLVSTIFFYNNWGSESADILRDTTLNPHEIANRYTPDQRHALFDVLKKETDLTLNPFMGRNFQLPAYITDPHIVEYAYYLITLGKNSFKCMTFNRRVKGIMMNYEDNTLLALSEEHPELYTFVSSLDFDAWSLDDRMRYINYLIESSNNNNLLKAFLIRCQYLIPGTILGGTIGLTSTDFLIELLPKKLKSKIKKYPLMQIAVAAITTVTGSIIGQSIEHMYRFRHTQTKY